MVYVSFHISHRISPEMFFPKNAVRRIQDKYEHFRFALSSPRFTIEKTSFINSAKDHLFKTHRLRTKLQFISIVQFRFSALVLYRIYAPFAIITRKGNPIRIALKFNYVADPGDIHFV